MTTPPKRTLLARTPEDVLALVPVVLGFVPTDSIVMLTFGASSPFHARIDLPDDRVHLAEATAALVAPAERHGVDRVVLVLYTPDAAAATAAMEHLGPGFGSVGIEVCEALLADGTHWYPLLPGRPAASYSGVPYDVTHHPLSVQAVVDGQVTHASRSELAATLSGAGTAGLAAVRAQLARREPVSGPQRAAEGSWVGTVVGDQVRSDGHPDAGQLARLLLALTDTSLRDVVLVGMTRETARQHVAYWTYVVRHAPTELVAAPAALLAFAAWLAGHGALAWCAVDRSREGDPEYGLAEVIGQVLARAVPPSTWEPAAGTEAQAPDPA